MTITTLAGLGKRINMDQHSLAIAAQTGKEVEWVRMAVLDYGPSNVIGRSQSGKGVERAGEAFTRISGVDVETGLKKRAKKA